MEKNKPSSRSIDEMSLEELQKEYVKKLESYKALKKEVEYQNLRAFAFEKMIEVAEKELNITIRKKPGTKVSKRKKRKKKK